MDKLDNEEIFEEEDFFEEDQSVSLKDRLDKAKEEIKSRRDELADKLIHKAEDVSDRLEEEKERVHDKRQELLSKFEEDGANLRETFAEYIDTVKSDIDKRRKGFNESDITKNAYMLNGDLAKSGYDWWWHSFTGYNKKTGKEKTFFIEYYLINPALGADKPILGQLPINKEAKIRPSYMMVKAGALGDGDNVQLHRFFAWDEVEVTEDSPFAVKAADCECSNNRLVGSVAVTDSDAKDHPEYMCDAGSMSWDLFVEKEIAFNVGLGTNKAVRELANYEMAWHAEGIKSLYGGTVTLGKDEYIVRPDKCYGYADKNWGRNYTTPWIWLGSSDLTSKIWGKKLDNSAFVIGGGRPVVGSVEIEDQLLGAFWYEGHPYEFNFSKPITLPKTKFRVVEGKDKVTWKIIQQTPKSKIYTSIECDKSDMINNNYESPEGEIVHNKLFMGLNGKGYVKIYEREADGLKLDWKLVDYIEVAHCGCEWGQ